MAVPDVLYRNPARDAARAMDSVAVLLIVLAILVTGGLARVPGFGSREPEVVVAVAVTAGQMAALVVASGIGAGLLLGINTALIDSAVALTHLASEGIVPRWLAGTRRGVPVRSIMVVVALNVLLVAATPSLIAIMAVGNLGYLLAHIVSLTRAALAASDLSTGTRRLAAILAVLDACIVAIGAVSFGTTGYGGLRELSMAIGVLLVALAITISGERGAERAGPTRPRQTTR
jgi:amino acid transporter